MIPPPPKNPVTEQAFSALTPLLTVIWLFSGLTTFSFLLVTGRPLVTALLLTLLTMIYIRGVFTVFRRWLVNRERARELAPQERRIIDIGRAATWRRFLWISFITALYFGLAVLVLGLTTGEAVLALPAILQALLGQVAILLIFASSNFIILFGPVLIFVRMGLDVSEPGDASWQVKISDVRGQVAAVEEMNKILHLIEQGSRFVQAGGLRERGILMVGPPGTGKTMLAKAIASSLHLPILVTSGASFVQMFIGMDVLKVLLMSRMAKKRARKWGGCAVFIDEFDALGGRRAGMGGGGMMGGMMGGGMMALNMLLVVMDGLDNPGYLRKTLRKAINGTLDALFIIPQRIPLGKGGIRLRIPPLKPPRYNIFFIGATNRPQVLDEAVTRPGRFGRQIIFKMPDLEDRKDIADLYFSRVRHDAALDTPEWRNEFALITKGYSPAMIQQSMSVALMYAFEHHREQVTWEDMREAMANIEAGLAEPVKYTEREALAVARHEVGHAVANRFFLPEMKSVRLSVRMRGGSLGHHQAVEAEEMFSKFRSWLAGDIRWGLGSIAAERVFYGENSQGVSHDLLSATRTAARMVGLWGMGPDARSDEDGLRAQVIGERLLSKAAAMETMTEPSVDATILKDRDKARDVAQMLGSAYVDAWRLMVKNKEAIDRLAHELVEKQELVGKEVDALLDTAHLQAPDGTAGWPDFLFSLDGGQHLCPRCHRLLPEGARYCINCGESLVSPLNPAQTTIKT